MSQHLNPSHAGTTRVTVIVAMSMALAGLAPALEAQICHGTPPRGGIEYNYERLAYGSSNGAVGTLAGSHVAVAGTFRARTLGTDYSGLEGDFRFSVVLGSNKLKVCPGLRIDYQRDTWDVEANTKVTAQNAAVGAGLGVGYEQELFRGLSVVPFVTAGYRFNLIAFDLSMPNSETDVTGDTLSGMQIEYGMIARYNIIYAGFTGVREPDAAGMHPTSARWIVGVTFGGQGSRGKSAPASKSRAAADKPKGGADQIRSPR